ncbi:hypothetical protein [Pseudochryseolinea flava]|uniref:DUF3472 domain-containing protein n=1 Tax=Pseudochryseolinea flava TaxID=2059302 RepID=A0A364Y7D2_9BACT|nr:hypothetical protein [Pseudochryseolinea flava]RAW02850.1 hypothetical protein DQQ10_01710 [Pseudochryseolinea flava]
MKYVIFTFSLLMAVGSFAQQQTYDLLSFTPPSGWTKITRENAIAFSFTDNVKRTWAQISIVKSTVSKGNMENDFQSEWKDLAVTPYGTSQQPQAIDKQVFNGWNFWSGSGKFVFNNENANLILSSFSDGQRCISFVIMSNTTAYGAKFDAFIASIQISQPTVVNTSSKQQPAESKLPVGNDATVADGFHFSTTNFDDGWTSVVKPDWVESTKGNVKVVLHYPRKEDGEYISQQVDRTKRFWDLLVAPRYVSASDFFFYEYNTSFEPAYFASANLTDKSGKTQFVALFSKAKSGWIEVIMPTKADFVKVFGVDRPDSYFGEWQALFNLSGLNRFAVSSDDLKGKWTSDFSSSLQYYNTFTGSYAGYNAYSSSQNFSFGTNRTYNWQIWTANSTNGGTVAQNAKSSGTFTMKGNWQVVFSKIENKPKTYNAYFSAIKGGRVLWLQDVEYGDYTPFGKAAK